MPTTIADPRALLIELFHAGLAAVDPARCLPPFLPPPPKGRAIVVGAGKASAAMAAAVEANWRGTLEGLVITRYGYGVPCQNIEIVEAAHPVPDEAGRAAGQRIVEMVRGLGEDDLVLCLISGGGSALMSVPAPGIDFADKQAVHRALVLSGANISEINAVRKRLSAVKGGRLAAACGAARVHTLIVSDVPGDDPAVVASGPTIRDATPPEAAIGIIGKYGIAVSEAVRRRLASAETALDTGHDFARDRVAVIARAADALNAAAAHARERGIATEILGDAIEGEAREAARRHAGTARATGARPTLLLSGGEVTVSVRGKGRGGSNTEFALGLALALDGATDIHALACDTDGIDGSEDNAGAVVAPDSLARARALGLDAQARLDDNDSYGFFAPLGDLVVTGPTLTNVNDFRAILLV